MQCVDLALVVHLPNAYCVDESEVSEERAHDTRQHVESAVRHLIIEGDE
jgi:hypothetical protein